MLVMLTKGQVTGKTVDPKMLLLKKFIKGIKSKEKKVKIILGTKPPTWRDELKLFQAAKT